jgi:hypothetical protein
MQPVSIPYDTVVYTPEHSASVILPLPDNSLFLPDTTITQDGITTTIGIQGGRASVKSRVSALPIQVKGNAPGELPERTVINNTVTRETEGLSLWGKIWNSLKNGLLMLFILAALILLAIWFIPKIFKF